MSQSINQKKLDEILDQEIADEPSLDIEQEAVFYLKNRGVLIGSLQETFEKDSD